LAVYTEKRHVEAAWSLSTPRGREKLKEVVAGGDEEEFCG
jgi:hypothetical protein